ncbi:hypothetical protein D1872_276550 [compost metagenome]
MRIDLILECEYVCLLFAFLGDVYLLKQLTDTVDHSIKMTAQHTDLVVIFDIQLNVQITALYLLH